MYCPTITTKRIKTRDESKPVCIQALTRPGKTITRSFAISEPLDERAHESVAMELAEMCGWKHDESIWVKGFLPKSPGFAFVRIPRQIGLNAMAIDASRLEP